MPFSVRDWMLDLLVYIDPDKTVSEALALMRRRYIHSILVKKTPTNPEYGILTSTDISDKIIAAGLNPSMVKVRDIMTSPIITAQMNWSLKECAKIMKDKKIHHMPVVDDKGTLVGIISASDFLVAAEQMGLKEGDRIDG